MKIQKIKKTNKFQKAGLGVGPFRLVGFREERGPKNLGNGMTVGTEGQPMGTCDYCGTGIANVYTIADSTGKKFDVGSECVRHTDDKELIRRVAETKKEKEAARRRTLARKRAEAERTARKAKAVEDRKQTLADHPELAEIVEAVETGDDRVDGEGFIRDIVAKLNRWGTLSEKQIAAVVGAWNRKLEWKAKRAEEEAEPKGDAPVGRVEVHGTILSVKWKYTDFGWVAKMLVKLTNNAKVYVTCPDDILGQSNDEDLRDLRGLGIRFRAAFTVSRDDKSFAFGSRPKALPFGK